MILLSGMTTLVFGGKASGALFSVDVMARLATFSACPSGRVLSCGLSLVAAAGAADAVVSVGLLLAPVPKPALGSYTVCPQLERCSFGRFCRLASL